MVALLVVSACDVARASYSGWSTVAIAGAALVATTRRVHPLLVLAGGAAGGVILDLLIRGGSKLAARWCGTLIGLVWPVCQPLLLE